MKNRHDYNRMISGSELDFPLIEHMGTGLSSSASSLQNHAHTGHELFFVIKGEALFELENHDTLAITGGHLSYHPPNTIHRGRKDHMAPCMWCWLIFNPTAPHATRNSSFSRQDLQQLNAAFKNKPFAVQSCNTAIQNSLRRFRTAVADHCTHPSSFTTVLLRSIVCELIIESTLHLNAARTKTDTLYGEAAEAFVQKHLFDRITVSDIARHLGFSANRTHTLFREQTGQSPNYYILSRRLKAAEKLLDRSPDSITHIALECGFSSSQYFARAFKKFNGVTPSEFRRSAGANPEKA